MGAKTMHTSAMIINTVAISFPLISMLFYSRLLLMLFWYKSLKKAPELHLFYCRFVLDWAISVISFIKMIIYGLSMTNLYDFFIFNHWLTFMFVWPVCSLSNLRAILVFLIALDRTCAAYLPLFFFKHRKLLPTFIIILFVLSYSFIDAFVVFELCKISLSTPTTCIGAQCINGTCYHTYWLTFTKIFYALIISLTIMLCLKIFFWDKFKKQNVNGDLRRANRLALIEAFIIVVFNFIPPILNTFYANYFEYVGAMNTVCQTLGFVVESWLTTINLHLKFRTDGVTSARKSMYPSATTEHRK